MYSRIMSDEHKKKISDTMKSLNLKRSEETRKKISQSIKKKWQDSDLQNPTNATRENNPSLTK